MDLRWNTIESVPKDGTWVILYNYTWPRPCIGRWKTDGWKEFELPGSGYTWAEPTMWCPVPHWEKQS